MVRAYELRTNVMAYDSAYIALAEGLGSGCSPQTHGWRGHQELTARSMS